LAVELALRENFSIGIEGSDLPIKNKLHNWPKYYGSVLHTADLTKPFYITRDNEKVLFDVISSWEVVEHIHPTQLDSYFENVLANLSDNGIFVASINTGPDIRRDSAGNLHYLHQSVFQEQYWREKLLKKYNVVAYPFQNKVRNCDNSFFVGLKK
jgi:predicted TPR repeat methyltransferase